MKCQKGLSICRLQVMSENFLLKSYLLFLRRNCCTQKQNKFSADITSLEIYFVYDTTVDESYLIVVTSYKVFEEVDVTGREFKHCCFVRLVRHSWHKLPHQVTSFLDACPAHFTVLMSQQSPGTFLHFK